MTTDENRENNGSHADTGEEEDTRKDRDRLRDFTNICNDIKESVKSFFPPELVEHLSNASKENLLAIRSLIDFALEKIDKEIENTRKE